MKELLEEMKDLEKRANLLLISVRGLLNSVKDYLDKDMVQFCSNCGREIKGNIVRFQRLYFCSASCVADFRAENPDLRSE